MRKRIKEQLMQAVETDYKKFNEKIIPGAQNVLGIRMPKLREIAKKAAKTDAEEYLWQLETALRNGEQLYHEEMLLYGLVIGYAKFDNGQRKDWLDRFIPYIDNWAVCDSCCMTYKWMKKDTEYWWGYLLQQIEVETEYSIRFAVVCMLDHFVNDIYIEEILKWCDVIDYEAYYVKMAVAWAVSVCYVKYPERTDRFLRENQMDDETQNKAIQKICDSYRVTKEQKQMVRGYKRK